MCPALVPNLCVRFLFSMAVGVFMWCDADGTECTTPPARTLLALAKKQPQFQEPLQHLSDTSRPQTHTLTAREGDHTDQWLGLQWDASPLGVLFLLDCEGHILDVFDTGAVETIQPGPTLGAAGETVLVTAFPTNSAAYKLEEADLFGSEGGKIHLLWNHTKHEDMSAFQTELQAHNEEDDVYTWSFEQSGTVIRVLGRRLTFPPPTPGSNGNALLPSVENLPAERYCWSSPLARYEGCDIFGPAPPLATPARVEQGSTMVPAASLDAAVIATLTSRGVKQPVITSRLDLTKPFGTVSPWTLVIAQDKQALPEDEQATEVDHGPTTVCFVQGLVPDCSESFYPSNTGEFWWFDIPFEVFDSRLVYAGAGNSMPRLLLKICGPPGGNGSCHQVTELYQYDTRTNRFHRVFLKLLGGTHMNEATHFVETGPIRGDIIADEPTADAPYAYWIEVYRPETSGRYVRVLRYRSYTRYGDANALAVADSEMPEILRRLGLWRSGDPLPIPVFSGAFQECSHPVMRKGEEWCN